MTSFRLFSFEIRPLPSKQTQFEPKTSERRGILLANEAHTHTQSQSRIRSDHIVICSRSNASFSTSDCCCSLRCHQLLPPISSHTRDTNSKRKDTHKRKQHTNNVTHTEIREGVLNHFGAFPPAPLDAPPLPDEPDAEPITQRHTHTE